MKVAPLMREFRNHPDRIKSTLVHTGQHYDDDMSTVFFEELTIPRPDIYLGVGSGTHAQQTAKVMTSIEAVMTERRPHVVLVVGDVNSTMASTLAAAKLSMPVAHVEAGLRSFDRTMPEEINRVVTDSLADLLFTTSRDADDNLLREGIPREKIHFVGNTMIDTLVMMMPQIRSSTILKRLSLTRESYIYVTLHRPSNVDSAEVFQGICDVFIELSTRFMIVWPLHPKARKMLVQFGLMGKMEPRQNIRLMDPVSYVESLALISNSSLVLTDSGGIQEETTYLGTPCLTLRENTERPITVLQGTNQVIGSRKETLLQKAVEVLSGDAKKGGTPELWDGRASERIVEILNSRFG
jgi:UDP-N-acetylglucosamine 2-epimerase (non-hydrolysing)